MNFCLALGNLSFDFSYFEVPDNQVTQYDIYLPNSFGTQFQGLIFSQQNKLYIGSNVNKKKFTLNI